MKKYKEFQNHISKEQEDEAWREAEKLAKYFMENKVHEIIAICAMGILMQLLCNEGHVVDKMNNWNKK